jgi:hypothetical protein
MKALHHQGRQSHGGEKMPFHYFLEVTGPVYVTFQELEEVLMRESSSPFWEAIEVHVISQPCVLSLQREAQTRGYKNINNKNSYSLWSLLCARYCVTHCNHAVSKTLWGMDWEDGMDCKNKAGLPAHG